MILKIEMKRLFIAFSAALVLLSSCVTSQKSLKESKPVAFVEARNYFHIGDETKPVILKITSKTEFERQFGEAAFMGKGGEPTHIDFNKSFVVAYIMPKTSLKTDLRPLSLSEVGKKELLLTYDLKQGSKQSYSTQPFFILIVNKRYEGYKVR
jgi:hypothetical protein